MQGSQITIVHWVKLPFMLHLLLAHMGVQEYKGAPIGKLVVTENREDRYTLNMSVLDVQALNSH